MASGITLGVSGLDTETIITELMKVERLPLVVLQNRQTSLTQKKAAWDSIKSKLDELLSKTTPLLSVTGFSQKTAIASDPSVLSVGSSLSAMSGTYEVEVSTLAKSQVVISAAYSSTDQTLGLSGDVTLNGQTITVDETDTISTLASKINGAGGVGATAAVLQVSEGDFRLVLTSAKTGTSGQMSFGDDAIWSQLGVKEENGQLNQSRAAADAHFTINGVAFVRSENIVNDAISGVTLTLNSAVNPLTGMGGFSSVEVRYDDQAVVEGIKAFVSEYNSLLDSVAKLSSWDADKKVGGLLFGDSMLQRMLADVRGSIQKRFGSEDASLRHVGQIGISTGAIGSFSRDGKLTLDEAKLKEALAADREGVAALLGVENGQGTGFLRDLAATVRRYSASDGYLPIRKQQLEAEDKQLSRQIEAKQRFIDARLATLHRQFSALEVLLTKLNNQGTWLSGQIEGLIANYQGTSK